MKTIKLSKMKTYLLIFLIFSLLLSFSSAQICGKEVDGALCPNEMCCSKYGYCGTTDDYCKKPGCQSNCWPHATPPPIPEAKQCGKDADVELCPNDMCCSQYGYCGTTEDYCKQPGCQSNCWPPGPSSGDLSDIITKSLFEDMLLHRNHFLCPARGFYTYDAFITAAKSFPEFGTTGDIDARKKEVAAFFGQTSQETTGRAPDGPYSWGYCYKEQVNPNSDYCEATQNVTWPCATGESYYGRGPMQLSWNSNYGKCGRDIGVDLLNNPNIVANDTVIAFKTAIWFWMTAQPPKPSCHDVITGKWNPNRADFDANRNPGYGVVTNIINGGHECGIGRNPIVKDRIQYYERYCDMLRVDPGQNLDCYNQQPFVKDSLNAAI